MSYLIEARNLIKKYSLGEVEISALRGVSLNVNEGELISLIGPSGSGKSTLMHILGCLDTPTSGEYFLDGVNVSQLQDIELAKIRNQKIGFVFQTFNLLPHLTVLENVLLPVQYTPSADIRKARERAIELLGQFGLENRVKNRPTQLSGGEMQRVAIARALSVMPKLLLLDEPFSNLDYSRKMELRERLFNYVKEHELSVIISTHEIQEILPWIDQIVVLQEGRLIQNDSAEETFKNPYNSYVAKLLGEVNTITDEQKEILKLPKNYFFPHQINLSENGFEATVSDSRFAGNHYWNRIFINNIPLVMYSSQKLEGNIKVQFEL